MTEQDIKQFLTAVKEGKMDQVKACLDSGMDIEAQDINLGSALYQAIQGKHQGLLNHLVDIAGADVNKPMFNFQFTPLIASVVSNNLNAFNFLMSKAELDVNAQNKTKETALHSALKHKRNVMIKALINHLDIDLSIMNSFHRTPLMEAVVEENEMAVKLILSHNYSYADFKNHEGKTALSLSESCKNKNIKILIEDAILDCFKTPIGVALKSRRLRHHCEKLFDKHIRELSDLTDKIDDKFLSWTCSISDERERQKILQIFANLMGNDGNVIAAVVAEPIAASKDGSDVPFAKVVP